MATKKKTPEGAQKEDVNQVGEQVVSMKEVIPESDAVTTSSPEPVILKAQDHTSVVIPYSKELAQGKELLYALRSWQKNVRFGINVVVIGDRENWFSEDITFIEHPCVSDNPQADTMAKLILAMSSPDVTERFIWTNDDIYLVNPVGLAHIEIPKVLGKLDPGKHSGAYSTNMMLTEQLLNDAKFPRLNYGTHTPFLFEKEKLSTMLEMFPEMLTGSYLFSSVYFNSMAYPSYPILLDWPTDQVLLPIVSKTPDEQKVKELLSRKVFLNNSESGYSPWLEDFLGRLFPEASDFEE